VRGQGPCPESRRPPSTPQGAGGTPSGPAAPAPCGHCFVPHTADVAFEAWGPTVPACLEECVRALAGVFVERRPASGPGPGPAGEPVHLDPAPLEEQLVNLLEEVIYRVEVSGQVALGAQVEEMAGGGLQVRLETVPVSEVELIGAVPKAVAWHQLSVRQQDGRWVARVTLDV